MHPATVCTQVGLYCQFLLMRCAISVIFLLIPPLAVSHCFPILVASESLSYRHFFFSNWGKINYFASKLILHAYFLVLPVGIAVKIFISAQFSKNTSTSL